MITLAASPFRSPLAWRNFPRIMIAVMLMVIAVNVRFIVIAVASFPGAATTDDFDTSNRYNAVLDQAARHLALGWSTRATTLGAIPVVDLARADGTPLAHVSLAGRAARPLGQLPPVELVFRETAPGHFVAAGALPLPGQWDLNLAVTLGGVRVPATRRVIAQ